MGLFTLAIVCLVVAVISGLVLLAGRGTKPVSKPGAKGPSPRFAARLGLYLGTALTLLCGIGSMYNQLDANTIGIVTALGRPVGTVGSGAHLLAPWDQVETFSTRIQVSSRLASADEGDKASKDCVQVKLKGGADACSDLTVRYRIDAKDAQDLWARYGSFDVVRDRLVRSATDNAARIIWGSYEPQDAISGELLPKVSADMKTELARQLANSGIQLDSVAVGELHLADDVQKRINGILQAQTDTQIAQQNKARNQAEADANRILTGSLTPEILTQQCLEAAKEIHPQVFNCFPGGATTPVIVGNK